MHVKFSLVGCEVESCIQQGANMVKWTKKHGPISQIHSFFGGQTPNSNRKICLNWNMFHIDLYCCVK